MTPLDGAVMVGSYDHLIVVLSALIAILASYTGLDLAERVTAADGTIRLVWLSSGAIAMGIGIWSMHYTAMLAFRLPVPVLYYWPAVLLSLLWGIVSSIIALFVVSRKTLGSPAALAGGIVQGAGISALHYTAMAGMRLSATCHYTPAIVALSVQFAVAGSLLSLWLMFFFRDQATGRKLRKAAGALLMGAAISGMHYTGMAAASFTASVTVPNLLHTVRVTFLGTAGIVTVTVMVLVGAVVTCLLDRLTERTLALGEANDRLRSVSASLQRAREQESARIAREIHDQLGSALTILRWDLEGLDRSLSDPSAPHDPDERKHKIAAMMKLTDQTVDSVRRIASELRPSILDDLGLVEAVEWQTRQFQARTGIICRFECSLESVDLSPEQSTAVFRILQEALTNVLRHAQATQVDIVMEQLDGSFVVTVTDNGRGITQDQRKRRSSLGLGGMQERALIVGGAVDVAGEEGKGTRVTVRIPASSALTQRGGG
jgi:signal transduction histidine kinase